MPRVISLFAGIGGFDLAFERAGYEVVAHVERDANCRKLLARKFPEAATLDDVRTAGAHNLPPCDVLVGGWPCQDLSIAGNRAGLEGERSGLFYEFARIANELKPSFLVWENVPGLLSSDDRRDLARVLLHLGSIGYFGAFRTLDAQHFGLAQRRRRVFGVFTRLGFGAKRCAEILSLSEGVRWHTAPSRKARESVAGTLGGSSQSGGFRTTDLDNSGAFICDTLRTKRPGEGGMHGDDTHLVSALSPALNCQSGQHHAPDTKAYVASHQAVRRLTPRECERLQGFPDNWTAGFADSTRYKMLGNAVAVPVVEWIARRLKKEMQA